MAYMALGGGGQHINGTCRLVRFNATKGGRAPDPVIGSALDISDRGVTASATANLTRAFAQCYTEPRAQRHCVTPPLQ